LALFGHIWLYSITSKYSRRRKKRKREKGRRRRERRKIRA